MIVALGTLGWAVVLGLAFVAVFAVARRLAAAPPGVPPAYEVGEDDPLLQEARARAAATHATFLALLDEPHAEAHVRFPFTTDRGWTEPLWGIVRSRRDDAVDVDVLTPPRDHQGTFETRRTVALDEIDDWQVEEEDGTLQGGFTVRARFAACRRDRGTLPRDWEEHERRFG